LGFRVRVGGGVWGCFGGRVVVGGGGCGGGGEDLNEKTLAADSGC
jgi:hypothetical protein